MKRPSAFAETGFIRGAAPSARQPGRTSPVLMTEGSHAISRHSKPRTGWTVGGTASYRFLRAKERADEADGLLPIAQLAAMGKNVFQSDPQPAKLYTESAGLVSFFFHGDGENIARLSFRRSMPSIRAKSRPTFWRNRPAPRIVALTRNFKTSSPGSLYRVEEPPNDPKHRNPSAKRNLPPFG